MRVWATAVTREPDGRLGAEGRSMAEVLSLTQTHGVPLLGLWVEEATLASALAANQTGRSPR